MSGTPLLFFGYFGTFSRYLADDYCTAGQLRTLGYLPSLRYWYLNWSGRYAFYSFINLTHSLGSGLSPWLPALTLIVWFLILYVLVRRVFKLLQTSISTPWVAALAGLIVFATLEGTPDIYQSFYWQTGLITYVTPLMILAVFLIWLLGRLASDSAPAFQKWELAFSVLVTFIAGGFSETYIAVQTTALILAFTVAAFTARGSTRRPLLWILGSGLAGTLAALVVVVNAPGNAARMAFMPNRLQFPELAFWSGRHALAFTAKSFLAAPFPTLAVFLVPGFLALTASPERSGGSGSSAPPSRTTIWILVGIPLAAFLLIVSAVLPAVFATAAYPAERALITTQHLLVWALVAWGYTLGSAFRGTRVDPFLRPAWLGGLLVIVLAAGAVLSVQQTLNRLPKARAFSSQWDQRDLHLRQEVAAGVTETNAPSLPHLSPGLGELSKDADDWINQCVAASYGLARIVAK